MHRTYALALAAALAALCVGCTSGSPHAAAPASSASGAPSRTGTTPVTAPAASPAPSSTPAPDRPDVVMIPAYFSGGFATPSGNVHCSFMAGWVWCAATVKPWRQLPNNDHCKYWDTTIQLQRNSGASLRGDCYAIDAPTTAVLGYGHGLQIGTTRCVSELDGLTCLQVGTHDGFFVSKHRYALSVAPSTVTTTPAHVVRDGKLQVIPPGLSGGLYASDHSIGCALSETFINCLMEQGADWSPPPSKPCAQGDTAKQVLLSDRGRGYSYYDCRTDELINDGQVLPAGSGYRVGPFDCTSEGVAIRCVDRGTGHGFDVSVKRFNGF